VRFFFAIVCFVLAAASIGLGLAERTVLAGPDHVTLTATARAPAPVVVVDGAALNAFPHTQTVKFSGGTTSFAAYGRTRDVLAWVGHSTYTHVFLNSKTGKVVARTEVGTSSTVPSAAGSDLWLGQYTGAAASTFRMKAPSSISLLAVNDGIKPAPSTVSLTWPLDNSTPWSGPLLVGGGVALLLGLILLLWAFTHMRRMRGPRRTQPRMPKLPRQPRYKPSRPKALPAAKGRRSIRRSVAIAPVVGLATLALAGCGIFPSTPVPTATATAKPAASSTLEETAVTPAQLQHIIGRVSAVTASADTNLDSTLVATRFEGAALQDRLANYKARKKDKKVAPSVAIPAESILVTLPQASNSWPRVVFTVIQNKATPNVAPVALMLVQDDPRSNYKVNYAMALQPKAVLPKVAGASVGATRIPTDLKLLAIQPQALALAYGDILMKDTASPSYRLFQAQGDTLRAQVGLAAKKAAQKKLPSTAKLTFGIAQGIGQVIALATSDSGAIVAVNLDEIETVRSVKKGASVSARGAIKALSGKASSTKGLTATYGDQLLFYVPSADKSAKIVLLGYSQGLIDAREYKK
jgi:hypothetical protein